MTKINNFELKLTGIKTPEKLTKLLPSIRKKETFTSGVGPNWCTSGMHVLFSCFIFIILSTALFPMRALKFDQISGIKEHGVWNLGISNKLVNWNSVSNFHWKLLPKKLFQFSQVNKPQVTKIKIQQWKKGNTKCAPQQSRDMLLSCPTLMDLEEAKQNFLHFYCLQNMYFYLLPENKGKITTPTMKSMLAFG